MTLAECLAHVSCQGRVTRAGSEGLLLFCRGGLCGELMWQEVGGVRRQRG